MVKDKSATDAIDSLKKRSHSGTEKLPGRTTSYNWVRDASISTAKICENVTTPVSSHWSVDELYFKTMGMGRFLFGVMDHDSRFVVATTTAYDKLGYDATNLFKKTVKIARVRPCVVSNDRLRGFKKGFQNIIANRKRFMLDLPSYTAYHISSAAVNKRHINNNRRERLNGIIKDRIKTVRGFNSKNPALLGLFITYYNVLRSHTSLGGKTPAQMLGISVRGSDKWATLLAYASTC